MNRTTLFLEKQQHICNSLKKNVELRGFIGMKLDLSAKYLEISYEITIVK